MFLFLILCFLSLIVLYLHALLFLFLHYFSLYIIVSYLISLQDFYACGYMCLFIYMSFLYFLFGSFFFAHLIVLCYLDFLICFYIFLIFFLFFSLDTSLLSNETDPKKYIDLGGQDIGSSGRSWERRNCSKSILKKKIF